MSLSHEKDDELNIDHSEDYKDGIFYLPERGLVTDGTFKYTKQAVQLKLETLLANQSSYPADKDNVQNAIKQTEYMLSLFPEETDDEKPFIGQTSPNLESEEKAFHPDKNDTLENQLKKYQDLAKYSGPHSILGKFYRTQIARINSLISREEIKLYEEKAVAIKRINKLASDLGVSIREPYVKDRAPGLDEATYTFRMQVLPMLKILSKLIDSWSINPANMPVVELLSDGSKVSDEDLLEVANKLATFVLNALDNKSSDPEFAHQINDLLNAGSLSELLDAIEKEFDKSSLDTESQESTLTTE